MNTTPPSLLADLQQRVSDLLRNSPAADIERNLKAMLTQSFQRMDLVTRDEFDRELGRVAHLQQRIEALERALARAGIASAGTDDEDGAAADGRAANEPAGPDAKAAAESAAETRLSGTAASGATIDDA